MQNIYLIKKVLFLIAIILVFLLSAFKHIGNFYERSKIHIIKQSNHKAVQLDYSKRELIAAFGKPDKDQKYFFEMDDKMGSMVAYKTDLFYFLHGKLVYFVITTPNFTVKLSKDVATLAVGTLTTFPKGVSKQSSNFFSYDLKNADGSTTDQFLEVDLKANKFIEKITLDDY